jgi:hypothetical protein
MKGRVVTKPIIMVPAAPRSLHFGKVCVGVIDFVKAGAEFDFTWGWTEVGDLLSGSTKLFCWA